MDGINGLCSGCAMIALMLIGFYSGLIYDSMLVLIIGSMIGFVLFNIGILGKKRGVFLGDSGSNLVGFWVAWIAIYASQSEIYIIGISKSILVYLYRIMSKELIKRYLIQLMHGKISKIMIKKLVN